MAKASDILVFVFQFGIPAEECQPTSQPASIPVVCLLFSLTISLRYGLFHHHNIGMVCERFDSTFTHTNTHKERKKKKKRNNKKSTRFVNEQSNLYSVWVESTNNSSIPLAGLSTHARIGFICHFSFS